MALNLPPWLRRLGALWSLVILTGWTLGFGLCGGVGILAGLGSLSGSSSDRVVGGMLALAGAVGLFIAYFSGRALRRAWGEWRGRRIDTPL